MTQPIEGGSAAVAPNSGAPAVDIGALVQQAANPDLTPQARSKLVDEIERYHQSGAQATQDAPAEVPEGFEPPSSPLAYTLENGLPPGAEITDQAGLGALKSGLHQLGVPAEIAAAGFAEIAHLHAQGTFASERAYDQQVQLCKVAMHKVHGENAPTVIREALAAVDAAVRAGRLTEEAAEAIVASPMALSKAAEFRRFGGKSRK